MTTQSTAARFLRNPLLVILAWLLTCMDAQAGLQTNTAALVVLPGFTSLGFRDKVDYIEDKDHHLSFEDVSNSPSYQWGAVKTEVPSFGFTTSTYWLRTAISNAQSVPVTTIFEISYPVLDKVVVHTINAQGQSTIHAFGDVAPFDAREIKNRNYLMELVLPPEETTTLIIQVKTSGSVQVPMRLWDRRAFEIHEQQYLVGQGLYLGILFVMAIYNLFIFFTVRDLSYVFYTLTVVAFGLFQASLHGLAFQFLWPDLPIINSFAISFWIAMFGVSGCCFTVQFLRLRRVHPTYYKIVQVFNGAMLIDLVLCLFVPYQYSIKAGAMLAGPAIIVVIVLSTHLWLRGHKEARYFLMA